MLLVLTIVTWRNYSWGTSLLGWDSVQPELNFGINLYRAMSNVWVENQGLGHIGGHGYATILVQGMIEWAISLVVGVAQTREVFIFAMLWLGPIGIYVLWKRWFAHTGKFREWGALLASLFYLFNLGTVQVFYAPLEAFTVMYGLLPWAIWSIVQYWQEPRKKSLVVLFLVQIIFSMTGFIPPQFVAYSMVLAALSVGYILGQRRSWWIAAKRVLVAGLVVLAANAYWLLPIAYYSMHWASSYVDAKNNQVSTPDFQYMSEARGTWRDVALMRGFFFDSSDSVIKGEGKFFEIFEPWQKHLQDQIERVGYGLFVVAMIGVLGIFFTKGKRSVGIGLVLILVIGWMAVAQAEEPFTTMVEMVRHIPVVGQAFRAAFTKFVCLLILGYSIGFGYGIWVIYKILREKMWMGILLAGLGVGSLVIFMWPMFNGALIYERMKINMPSEYGQVMKYFGGVDKQARIAYLPSAWMWGWQVHEWGYSGSGFLWYGMEQPILDRAFDVWSPFNETFYNQFSSALYECSVSSNNQAPNSKQILNSNDQNPKQKCSEQIRRVLEQYNVRYVLLDESIIAPGQSREILRINETKKIAEELGWREVFREGFLTVWDTGRGETNNFVSAPEHYVYAEGDPPSHKATDGQSTVKTRIDTIYRERGSYVTGAKESIAEYYPLADLLSEEVRGITYEERKVTIRRELPQGISDKKLTIPAFSQGSVIEVGYTVTLNESKATINWDPMYMVNGQEGPSLQTTELNLPSNTKNIWVKIGYSTNNAIFIEDGSADVKTVAGKAELIVGEPINISIYDGTTDRVDDLTAKFAPGNVQNCWNNGASEQKAFGTLVEGYLRLVTKNASACMPIPLEKSTRDELIQVVLNYKSESAVKPQMCLDEAAEPYKCENEDVWTKTLPSRDWSWVMRTVGAKSGEQYWLDVSSRAFAPYEEERTIDYKVPIVARYNLLLSDSSDGEIWSEIESEQAYDLSDDELMIEISSSPTIYDLSKFGLETPPNCDVLTRGTAGKEGERYEAEEYGAVCDYMELTDIRTDLTYLMRIAGENVTGRSIKFFLHNNGSQRNDLEYLLGTQKFDQTFSLINWEFEGNYTLNTETRSFGNRAENVLSPVELRYMPLTVLARAKIGNAELINNRLEVTSVQKTGTWLYVVEMRGSGVLRLSQGFDEGWIGVGVGDKRGYDLVHVKVDGWANGWIVEQCAPSSNDKCSQIEKAVIFYWPQLLEYLGSVMLGTTLILILKPRSKRKKLSK